MKETAREILKLAESGADVASGEWEAKRSQIIALAVELARTIEADEDDGEDGAERRRTAST